MDGSSGSVAVTRAAAAFRHAELEQDALEGTEACEPGLEQIQANEDGEEQPALIHPMGERKACENEAAGDGVDNGLGFHSVWSVMFLMEQFCDQHHRDILGLDEGGAAVP
jgi:hypothetical protein